MEISSKEFEKLKYIGEGEEGIVRKKGKYALKKFFELGSYKKACLKPQYDIISTSFIFPNQPLFIDGIYIGCLNNFIVGSPSDTYKITDFENFINLVKKVEAELTLLSDSQVTILDLLPRNALINEEGFKIIDTTRYQLTSDKYECSCLNKKRLNYFFIKYFLLKYMNEEDFIKLISEKYKLYNYFCSLTYIETHNYLSSFLTHFIDEFNIKTIEDYNQKVLTLR